MLNVPQGANGTHYDDSVCQLGNSVDHQSPQSAVGLYAAVRSTGSSEVFEPMESIILQKCSEVEVESNLAMDITKQGENSQTKINKTRCT